MKRRSFLKTVGGAAAGTTLATTSVAKEAEDTVAGMPRRTLGRTGLKASIVAFPGLVLAKNEQEKGTAALKDALRRGVNYFDVAPAYGDAEIKMGIAL